MPEDPDIEKELKEAEKQGLLKKILKDDLNQSNSLVIQNEIDENIHLKSNLLDSLLENIPDSIYFKDKNGRYVETSAAKVEHLKTDKESIIGKTDFDFYLEEEAKKMRDDENYVMENKEVIRMEEKITRPNGNTVWVSVVKTPWFDSKGNVIGVIGISRDITLQKEAERALYLSEEKYRTIFDNSAVAIMMTDESENIIQWNNYTEQLLGMGRDDLLNRPVRSLYPEVEWCKIRQENIRKKGMQHHLETKMLRKDGELIDVDISLSVLKGKNSEVTGSIGVVTNITDRKKMESELCIKDSAIESSINAIAITDFDGNIKYLNPSFLRLWGYESGKVKVGEPIDKVLKDKDKFVEIINTVKDKDGWVGTLKGERENKSLFDIQLSATKVKNNKNEPICMMISIVDITRRVWAEKKLHQLNVSLEQKVQERTAEIEKLLKQKDEFIGQLGHDLKTPLSPINALLPLVRKKENNEQSIKYLDLAIKNVNYMKNLIEKTLKLALINSTSFKLDIEDTNAYEIIDRVIQNRNHCLKEYNKDIKIENLIEKNIVIEADKLRFEELVDNIISNACKYSPHGGKVTIKAEREENKIRFSVKDEGQGMIKEQIEKIFDEFYKVDESRHDFHSTGLGLSICKRIVEKHGGNIWVESPGIDKGSIFYFTFILSKDNKNK